MTRLEYLRELHRNLDPDIHWGLWLWALVAVSVAALAVIAPDLLKGFLR